MGRENVEFLETKRRIYLDEMDGILVGIAKWCAHTGVVEQGWEMSILSQLRTELL